MEGLMMKRIVISCFCISILLVTVAMTEASGSKASNIHKKTLYSAAAVISIDDNLEPSITRGWSVSAVTKLDVETYEIAFVSAFPSVPICTATPGLYSAHPTSIDSVTTSSVVVRSPDGSNFSVICLLP